MDPTDARERAAGGSFDSLSRRARRRLLLRSLLRAVLITTGLLVIYYSLPLEDNGGLPLAVNAVVAVITFVAVCVLNVWGILRSDYPRLRAVDAAAAVVPLLVVLVSAIYVQIAAGSPQAFTEPLDRTDALYFTVTVLATVGFGDIAPVATSARVVTMVQMLGDLVLFGLFARFLANNVTEGLRRRALARAETDEVPTADES
jgi:voltage-gated potassium channel